MVQLGSKDSLLPTSRVGMDYSSHKKHMKTKELFYSGRIIHSSSSLADSPYNAEKRRIQNNHHSSGGSGSVGGNMETASAFSPLIQLFVLLAIFVLVIQSDSQASMAASQLQKFRKQESSMLLQLQRIERQSLQLHENVQNQLKRAGMEDSIDPLGKQANQLYKMSKELNSQVQTLQEGITDQSIDNIVQEFGEGPVKVIIELQFSDKANKALYPSQEMEIAIMLWPDVPHAIWTWLEQIGRNLWDESIFDYDSKGNLLTLEPTRADPLNKGRIEFIEYHDGKDLHGAWTIGLREVKETGQLQMFVNLQDNHEFQKHETCVGKIVDGFHSLQRMLELKRSNGDLSAVRVKRVGGMHMTFRGNEFY